MRKFYALIISFHLMLLPMPAHAFIGGGMKQLTGIAIAGVGVSVVTSCKIKHPSILMFIAGAAAYVMGEMSGGKEQTKGLEETNDEVEKLKASGVKGGELQLKSMEAQLDAKEKERKVAKKRSTWIGAAQAMFMGAAALAAMEILPESLKILPPAMCEPGSGMALGKGAITGIIGAYSFLTGGGIMGALSGAALGMFAAQSLIIGKLNTAVGRVAAFGVVSLLVGQAKGEVSKEVTRLDKEIADLKEMIAQFRLETDGKGPNSEDTQGAQDAGLLALEGSSGTNGISTTAGKITALPDGQNVNGVTTCINANQELSNSCSNPMKINSPNLSILGNQPELQQFTNQGIAMANDAVSGNFAKADVAAAGLNASAAKIDGIYKRELAKVNAKLRSQGKAEVGTKKEMQDTLNSMQSAYDKEMSKLNDADKKTLASLGMSGKLTLDPESDKSGQDINSATADSAIGVPTSTGSESIADVVKELDANSGLIGDSNGMGVGQDGAAVIGDSDANLRSIDSSQYVSEDVSKNRDGSLWKQVSDRYLLQYDRFFERKKVPAQ